MLLDFDGWLGKQSEDTRNGVNQHLNILPETDRPAEKRRLASMFAVSNATGLDVGTVNEKWDTVRGGFAEQMGGDWLAAKDDEPKFYGQFVKKAQAQRDERHLMFGLDDEKAPEAKQAFQDSLFSRAQEAAYAGESYANALGAWQESAQGKPGYDPARAAVYADTARQIHSEVATMRAKVKPIADDAFVQIGQARGARGVKLGEGDSAPVALFRGLSPEEKTMAFRMMTDIANSGTQNKERLQAFSEAVGRGFENMVVGGRAGAWRSYLLKNPFKAGDLVPNMVGDDPLTYLTLKQNAEVETTVGDVGGLFPGMTHNLTEEEATRWNKTVADTVDDIDTGEQLRQFGQQVVDPTKAGGAIFQKFVLPAAESTALMVSMSIPGLWVAAMGQSARSYQNDEYLRLRAAGLKPKEANELGQISGLAEAALDKLEVGLLKGIPGTKNVLERFALRGGAVSRFIVNTAGTTVAETAIELTQDHIIPAIVQDNLASDPAFDVHWGEVWKEVAKAAPDTAMGMVLLSGIGGISQTREQTRFAKGVNVLREFSDSKAALRARGFSMEHIAEIQAAPMEERDVLISRYMPTEAPTGAARDALVADVVKLSTQEQETFKEKQEADQGAAVEAAGYAIRVTRNAGGWEVTQADGASVKVDSAEAARRIREDLRQASTEKEAAALVSIVDNWHANAPEGTARETTLTGETVRSDGQSVTHTRDGEIVREVTSPAILETIRNEAAMDGSAAIDVLVNGSNAVEFAESVAGGAKAVVQRLELHQSDSTALTAIHEQVEAMWRTGIAKGTITHEETKAAVAAVSTALDPAKARTPEEKSFRERVQRVAAGTASETEVRETVSELAVAEVIGRRKDGTAMPAGSLTTALDAALMNSTDAAEVKALGKFRAMLRAVRRWFRAVFGTVAALQKAKRESGTQDFEALIDKLLGLDEQAEHEKGAAAEAAAIAGEHELDYTPPSAEEEANGIAFSVSAGSRLELVSNRLDAALAKDPAKRRELARAANIKLQSLAFDWETDRLTGKGDKIRPLVDQRSPASLDREERVFEAFRREELEAQAYTRHAGVLSTPELAKVWGGPVMQALSKPGTHLSGRLKSKSEAMRSATYDAKTGDYDGMDGVPRVVFGGDLMPDQAAQELHDQGLLREPTADALWNAIRQDVARSEQWKGFLAAANEDLRKAKEQARSEAGAWRAEQAEMQKKDWNPKARLLRDLRTLDALLSVFPAEVRGKVGGFVKLATLGTDKARLDEIGRRIEKLSEVVEKHLQKETTEAMDSLVEKAKPDREGGQQSRGKIGVDAHRYFDQVASVMALTTEEVEARKAGIEAAYADPAITDEQVLDLFEREQILDTFGAWANKSAADMDSAFRAAEEVYQEGRNRWRIAEEARIGEVKALAGEVISTLGGPSYAKSQAQKTGSKLKKISLDLKSFAEVLDTLLGGNHPLVKRWSRAAQEGFAQKNDGIRALNKRWNEALKAATGKSILQARRVLWEMGQKQTITVDTAGETTGSTQDVPISIIDAWARGEGDPSSLGISDTESAQLQAERAAMDDTDRRQSLPLSRTGRGLGEVVKMTEAEAIFLTMLSHQEQYADALDRAGWNTIAIDEAEKQISPSGKNLREFLRKEYREGYTPLASVFERMFGVELPQIKNYAPAAFYHVGAERAMDPSASGTVEGNMRAGFLKNRKKHAAAPRLENAFATFFGHANQTEHWKALAEFVREFSGVMGKPDVKRAIEAAHGKEMLAAVSQWTKALEGNGLQVQAGQIDGIVNWLTSQQAKIKLAWKLGTILKQSSAVLGSAFRIPLGAYARGFGKLLTGQLEFREMFKSPLIQRRLESGFAPEIRDALNQIWTAKPTMRASLVEKGMEIIGFADAFFTTGSAAIAFDYHLREAEKSGLTGESARAAAMTEVEDIVNRTAQPADVVNRSLAEMRMGAFGRLAFLFASEARQKSSMWLTAWGHTFTGKATAADYRVLAISHLVLGPMIQAITAAWRDAQDDDDDELFDTEHWSVSDFIKAAVAGPLSGIPLIGAALSGFRDDGIFGSAKKAWTAAKQIAVKTASEKEDKEAEPVEWYVDRISRVMQGLDAQTGVAGSVINQAFHVVDNFIPDSETEADGKERRRLARERREAKEED
jgi:hypothetical protein